MRRPVELMVLEAKDRIGGVIWTDRFDGFTLEGGPDSFITNKPWGLDLCHRLGLADQLVETDASKRRSFVVRNGRLLPVPEGFVLMAPQPVAADPDDADPLASRQAAAADGPGDPAAERRGRGEPGVVRAPPVRPRGARPPGAAAGRGDLHGRSLRPELERDFSAVPGDGARARQRDSGALRAKRASGGPRHLEKQASGARYGLFVTLADGMDTLPKALAAALPAGTVRTSTAVRRISRNEPVSPWLVELLDGPPLEADAVVVATEAHAAARFLDAQDPAPGASAPGDSVRVVTDRQHRLSARPDQPSARRLRRRRAGDRGAVDPGGLVPEREVSQPGAGGDGAAASLHRRRRRSPNSSSTTMPPSTALVQQELGGLIGASGEPIFTRIAPASAGDAAVQPRASRSGDRDSPQPCQVLPSLPRRHRLRRRGNPRLHSRRRKHRRFADRCAGQSGGVGGVNSPAKRERWASATAVLAGVMQCLASACRNACPGMSLACRRNAMPVLACPGVST